MGTSSGARHMADGTGSAAVGTAAGGTVRRHDRTPAVLGKGRGRWLLVGLGVLGTRVRRPGASQGGPGPRRYPAPAGATRRLQRRAAAGARPGRADPGCRLTKRCRDSANPDMVAVPDHLASERA